MFSHHSISILNRSTPYLAQFGSRLLQDFRFSAELYFVLVDRVWQDDNDELLLNDREFIIVLDGFFL